jgi:hypothetical protein
MPNFDLIMITTVEADTYEDACEWLRGFADGLSDMHGMPITSEYPGMAEHDNDGQRVFYLMPIPADGGSASAYDPTADLDPISTEDDTSASERLDMMRDA